MFHSMYATYEHHILAIIRICKLWYKRDNMLKKDFTTTQSSNENGTRWDYIVKKFLK